jgi:hypothetical protein
VFGFATSVKVHILHRFKSIASRTRTGQGRLFIYKTIPSHKKHQNTKGHIKIVENLATSLDMTTKERVLKFTVMQHRNPNISEDEFNTYWTTKHAVAAATWLQRNGVLGYTQVSLDLMLVA